MQERISAAVDHWRDISGLTDLQAAQKIALDEVDVLIDLNGYTKHARTKIFAYRPAPVIVNWCGYPGTMGSPYHHYLIADRYIIPPENEIFYSERVLRIPCNQPIDRKRQISAGDADPRAGRPARRRLRLRVAQRDAEADRRTVFARWMTILSEVPGQRAVAAHRRRATEPALASAAAAQRRRAPSASSSPRRPPIRTIFARISLADLFLDTTPYGAHSTAADALTMGLPILTLQGRSFASRFCSSVIAAAGLADLICGTPEEYVKRAIAFGRDPQSLVRYRDRLRLGPRRRASFATSRR